MNIIDEKKHISRQDVLKMLGISAAALSHWQNRKERPFPQKEFRWRAQAYFDLDKVYAWIQAEKGGWRC